MVELYLWPGGLVDLLVTGDISLLPKSTARSCQSAGRTSSTCFSSDHTFLSTIDYSLQKNNMFEYTHSMNFKHFAWPKIHPRLLPLATGKLLLSVIRRPGIWSVIATDSISQMFYNYYQLLLCHNFFIIIISDYYLSINSQLLWPARCPNIWSIVTDSISQVTRSKSGEIRNQSLQAVCLQRTLWFLFNRMFMAVLWHQQNTLQEHIVIRQ